MLCAQALSCAYYGIFAGLMVGLGTLFFARHARAVAIAALLGARSALAAAVSLGLTLPFFLPYLQVQDQGFGRTLDDARDVQRQRRRLAGVVGLGASLVAAAPSRASARCCSRACIAVVAGVAGAVERWRSPRRLEPRPIRAWRATWPASTWLLAVIAFWASFGPDAGLYRLLFETVPVFALLRAPARMGIIVTLALVVLSSAALAPWLRARARPRVVGRRAGRAGRARAEHRAADRAARGAAGARGLPDAGPAAAGAAGRVPVLLAPHRLPAACRVHARLDVPLAAAGERLQRLHPRASGGGPPWR